MVRISPPQVIVPLDCFQKDQQLNHTHIPNKTCQFKTLNWNVSYNINSQGLRDKEYPLEKPQNSYRILSLGDSFTEGWGVKIEDSYPKQLETLLNSHITDQRYEVINTGVAGYSTVLEYLYLKNKGLNTNPDMVTLAFDMSDFAEEKEYSVLSYSDDSGQLLGVHAKDLTTPSQSLYMEMLNRSAERPISKGFMGNIEYLIRSNSALARKILPISKETIIVNPNFFQPDNQSWDLVKKNLTAINDLLKAKNIKFLLIVFPHYDQTQNRNLEEPLATLDDFAQSQQIPILNLTTDFNSTDPKKYYLPADLHFSKEGNTLLANKIFEYLKSQGITKPN